MLTGQFHDSTSPSRSYFMSNNDFLFSENLDMTINEDYKTFIQPLVLNEFQPEQITYLSKLLVTALGSKSDNVAKAIGVEKIWEASKEIFTGLVINEQSLTSISNRLTDKYSKNPSELYSNNLNSSVNPMTQILRMFTRR